MFSDTIAAISTPFAQGGIGIIRISGADAKKVASKVFRSIAGKDIEKLAGYTALFGFVFDSSGEFDEAILLNFNKPRSYTGEDVVEISVHSGLYILKRVLRAALDAGARLAEEGEFTKRAFLNGKLSLTQAESVMDLISAQSGQAVNAALNLKKGIVFKEISEIINTLVKIDAHISAWVDYPEEDIIDIDKNDILKSILDIKSNLVTLADTFDISRILKGGINTAIVGKPNVGKSTLMNLLSGTNKSIVTDIPGTTRDVIEENILLDDIVLNLFDTAGLRETSDIVEQHGVCLAKEKIKEADIILAVFDNSREFDEQDKVILKEVHNKKTIAVINKIDLPSKLNCNKILEKIKNTVAVDSYSIKTKVIIANKIKQVLNIEHLDSSTMIISNERQLQCIRSAINSIENVINTINSGYTFDAISVDIESTIDKLMELTGEKVSESVVNQVFKNFCVGK